MKYNKHTYVEGDKSSGICETCKKKVSTYFKKHTLQNIPDVLVSICQECGNVVGIPAQSIKMLKK